MKYVLFGIYANDVLIGVPLKDYNSAVEMVESLRRRNRKIKYNIKKIFLNV